MPVITPSGGNGGSMPAVATATITTDASTYDVEHVFDLENVATAYVSATLLSTVADGATFGTNPGEIAADINAITRSRDGVSYPFALSAAGIGSTGVWDQDDPYTGSGSLPLVTHQMQGVTGRYIKVRAQIQDGSTFDPYAGPNHPTATWRIDVEYLG